MKFKKAITLLSVLLFSGGIFAASDTDSNRSVTSQYSTTTNRSGWLPSVGLGFGHLDQSGNSDVDGDSIAVTLLSTWYFDNSNWLADAGIGIQKQYFTDSQPTAGLVTFSGRYELARQFSVGPVLDLMFGTTEDFGSANNYYSMAGVQGFKEINFSNDHMLRIGLKFTTQFGISDQTSNLISLIGQWSIGSGNTFVQKQRSDVSFND